ncbi:gluconate:H+ symporter [Marinilongibacter aquaticus]|uniref:gluconate:H+ symporter n=1 Tax=Marinilongibacter aquaticus TaxID=2975157 RepID=UPI0021BD7D1E|nr:gluconate:H+ symporter [Marinilongibacter aquaticus]UBM60138.1 gluconate:H+ symporter [Marinilongibacter aquaticus]
MPLVIALIGIVALILLIAVFKLDTFISFIIVSLGIGLASGLDVVAVGDAIKHGVGSTLGDLTLIIGFGAMLGKLVAESGAAQKITDALLKLVGKNNIQWGLALAGFIIGIPLFYNAGFIIVIPLIFAIAQSSGYNMLYVGIPMLASLSVAHGYLPPHPSPAAISLQLNADLGKTLIYGIIVSIPAVAIAGPIFAKTLKSYKLDLDPALFGFKQVEKDKLPPLGISLLVGLMPVILLSAFSVIKGYMPDNQIVKLLAQPYFGMLLSVFMAIYFLGIKQGQNLESISKSLADSFKDISVILLIIAGAGALKEILSATGTSEYIGRILHNVDINPLILGWATAAFIRVCVGSATVSGLTAVGILAPMFAAEPNFKPELMVLAIGSGSLIMGHMNDGGFWLFKEYFNLSIKDTLKTWTVMETLVSVVGLIGVLILNLFI